MGIFNYPQAIERHKVLRNEVIGTIFPSKFSGNMKVLEYIDCNHVKIEFLKTHNTKWVSMINVRRGEVGDTEYKVLFPHICGIGYIGIGQYSKKQNKKIYDAWYSMLARCYDSKTIIANPTYKGCSVCEEWHNFQKFAAWFENHCKCEKPQVDKDIRVKGNKIYSPDNCCILPSVINKCFVNRKNYRGKYPIGVEQDKNGKFIARLGNVFGFKKYLGYYDNPEKAFNAYKGAKEQLIHYLAEKYKKQLDDIAYNALLNYQVEITD